MRGHRPKDRGERDKALGQFLSPYQGAASFQTLRFLNRPASSTRYAPIDKGFGREGYIRIALTRRQRPH